jgi:hypothetical protein
MSFAETCLISARSLASFPGKEVSLLLREQTAQHFKNFPAPANISIITKWKIESEIKSSHRPFFRGVGKTFAFPIAARYRNCALP